MTEPESDAVTDSRKQCHAITQDGERCSRTANENRFCHLHGPDDETIDDESYSDDDVDERSDVDEDNDSKDEASASLNAKSGDDFDILAVHEQVESVADDLFEKPIDRIIEISPTEDGWQVFVEVVERSAVPDTQDILGQYNLTINESGNIAGYRLSERYRRGDSREH